MHFVAGEEADSHDFGQKQDLTEHMSEHQVYSIS